MALICFLKISTRSAILGRWIFLYFFSQIVEMDGLNSRTQTVLALRTRIHVADLTTSGMTYDDDDDVVVGMDELRDKGN